MSEIILAVNSLSDMQIGLSFQRFEAFPMKEEQDLATNMLGKGSLSSTQDYSLRLMTYPFMIFYLYGEIYHSGQRQLYVCPKYHGNW